MPQVPEGAWDDDAPEANSKGQSHETGRRRVGSSATRLWRVAGEPIFSTFSRMLMFVLMVAICVLLGTSQASAAGVTSALASAARVYGQPTLLTNAANNGGISANSLAEPIGVAVDASGGVYVADNGNNRVLFYPSGSTTATRVYGQPDFNSNAANNGGITANSLSGPTYLTLDQSGDLYVSDARNARVVVFPPGSTTATRVYGPVLYGGAAGGVVDDYLQGIAVDHSGNLYVGDSDGILLIPAGSSTVTRFFNRGLEVSGLTVDANDNLYASQFEDGAILVFPKGSNIPSLVFGRGDCGSPSPSNLGFPFGLALDALNNLYVADGQLLNCGHNRVLVIPNGSTSASNVYGQKDLFSNANVPVCNLPVSATVFCEPEGLAIDKQNNLYVVDSFDNRVLVYPSSRSITMNPTSGPPGSTLAVSGSGFAPNSQLTFKWDGASVLLSGPTSDGSGNFGPVNVTVPTGSSAAPGAHTITVTDAQGDNAPATFTVTQTVLADFKQDTAGPTSDGGTGGPWAGNPLGCTAGCVAPSPLLDLDSNPKDDCDTIFAGGCALASFADVAMSYGVNSLSIGGVDVPLDPGSLNRLWATIPPKSCYLPFETLGLHLSQKLTAISTNYWTTGMVQASQIQRALNDHYLPIIHVATNPKDGHWVVVYQAVGNDDFKIVNPWSDTFEHSGMLLSQAYPNVPITQMKVLAPDVTPAGVWTLRLMPASGGASSLAAVTTGSSVADIVVTDSTGRRTGFIAGSGAIAQIPHTSYVVGDGIVDPSGIHAPLPSTPFLVDEKPDNGIYQVQVIGEGPGPYTLEFSSTDASGNTIVQSVNGVATAGSRDAFQLQIGQDSIPPMTSVTTVPVANQLGWNSTGVMVNLNASDNLGGSGVKQITYSAVGAQVISRTTVNGSSAAVTIASEGVTTLSYYATDNAGNVETTKTLTIKIDEIPPTVTYSGNQGTYTIDQTINITCTATDPPNGNGTAASGLSSTTCQNISAPAYSFPLGSSTFSATATDNAGNIGQGSVTFTVEDTYASLCNLTRQFVSIANTANPACNRLGAAQDDAAEGKADKAAQDLSDYRNEISRDVGRSLTSSQAAILTKLSQGPFVNGGAVQSNATVAPSPAALPTASISTSAAPISTPTATPSIRATTVSSTSATTTGTSVAAATSAPTHPATTPTATRTIAAQSIGATATATPK